MGTRRPFVCGNWKMNTTPTEGAILADAIVEAVGAERDVDIAVAPPFTGLDRVARALGHSSIKLAAQDVHWEEGGAFTGMVGPSMLRDLCASVVIVGHSERRTLFAETDETCGKKVRAVLGAGLRAILCVGETLEQREAGKTLDVVGAQLDGGLAAVTDGDFDRIIIAYEPVWAIGTGRTATPEQAQEVHAFIRGRLRERFDDLADTTVIQYGGSMKPGNAAELLAQPDIDGGLIGGASLKAADFAAIVQAARAVQG